MVGGAKASFDKSRPIFATSGANIFHVGELGAAAITKIALQTVVCINMLAASEGMILAEKAGINLTVFQKILHSSSAQSMVVDHWFDRFKVSDASMDVRRRRLEVFHKGLMPALELAHELNLSVPGVALTQQFLPRILGLVE
jgi:3-hydroxyisobutyrate dehydrogenase